MAEMADRWRRVRSSTFSFCNGCRAASGSCWAHTAMPDCRMYSRFPFNKWRTNFYNYLHLRIWLRNSFPLPVPLRYYFVFRVGGRRLERALALTRREQLTQRDGRETRADPPPGDRPTHSEHEITNQDYTTMSCGAHIVPISPDFGQEGFGKSF